MSKIQEEIVRLTNELALYSNGTYDAQLREELNRQQEEEDL